MSYYQKIKELLEDEDEFALPRWMDKQPLTERLIILQTIREVMGDLTPIDDSIDKSVLLQQFDNFSEAYSDMVLDAYNARLQYEKAVKENDEKLDKVIESMDALVQHIIDCVTSNAPNAKEMKALALRIIEEEKKNGFYDPENWKGIV